MENDIKIKEAFELYANRNPNLQNPTHHYFPYVENPFRQEGNRKLGTMFVIHEESEINILAMVQVDETVFLREISL